jgi:site-specific DNA recombinase
LISEDLFAAVQEQLQENRQRARQGQRGVRYLLQGLICCGLCGYAYYGKAISPSTRRGHPRHYAYYRCTGSDAYRFGGTRLCDNKQVRTDLVDAAVWQEVCTLLKEPDRLQEEYERRLRDPAREGRQDDLTSLESQIRKLRQGMGRLIDSYADGLIDKGDFEPRITRLKDRMAALEVQVRDLRAEVAQQQELRLVIGKLEDFAAAVRDNLEQADWETQRTIIRALVKRVEIEQEQVNVVFRIGPNLNNPDPTTAVLPDCGRRDHSTLRCTRFGGVP